MSFPVGTKLGPYEILAPLGAGGMGEVYRARDTRLKRDVALKVLPGDFADDPARQRRFEQEARVVAALNHPNIVAVYDVGENFLVSELVDGQTLRHAGKLSQRQAIDLAVQIAEGLAAAHVAGITHRDLKPDNIMVTRDGRAKILDFGLAKIAQATDAGSQAPTETQDGMIMGTIGYMSPEQVKGQPADSRSDIFSFGVVLYEMLAGRRAFTGGSSMEVMSAILKEAPQELPESIPAALRKIVEHCLDKNPDRRFQSARDLAFALQMPAPQALPAKPSGTSQPGLTIAGAIAVAAVSIAATHFLWRAPEPALWTGVMLGGPEMALSPRPSPDGHLLAFAAMVDGLTQVAVMKPESGNWTVLTHDRTRGQVGSMSWSPDGALIHYCRINGAVRGLYSVPVLGGEERLLLENAGRAETLPDGTIIFVRTDAERKRKLHRFWPGTGQVQALPFQPDFTASQNTTVKAFPDGKTVVAFGEPAGSAAPPGLYTIDLSSGSMKRMGTPGVNGADITAFSVVANGKSVVAAVNSGTLTRITSFAANGAGGEQPMFTVTSTVWDLDASVGGSVYVSLLDRPSDLVRFRADGTQYEKLASFALVPEDADIMTLLPDGRAVVVVRASGQNQLMLVEKDKDPAVLVNTAEETTAPMAPCGSGEVVFLIGPAPHETLAFTEPSTGRVVRRIAPGKGVIDSVTCATDGATVYFSASDSVWSVPSSGGEARRVRAGERVVIDPSGKRLIVQVRESAQVRLYSVPLDGGPEREIRVDQSIRMTGSPLSSSGLSPDGRLLAPLAPRDSWFNPPGVLDTATGRVTRIPSDNQGDYRSMGWTRDGRIIAVRNGLRATLWKFQAAVR